MKRIFVIFCFVMLSGFMRLGDYNSFGFRDVIFDFSTYKIMPADDDYKLMREEQVTEEFVPVNERHVAYAGNTVYYIKVYNVKYYERPVLKANHDGELKGLSSPVKFDAEKNYEIIGLVEIDGVRYAVVPVGGRDLVLVDENGKIKNQIGLRVAVDSDRMSLLDAKFRLYPNDLKFETDIEGKKEVGNTLSGIEIVYKGKSDKGYVLAYRDFYGNGDEEYQYVNFSQDYEFVDFGNMRLRIDSITPERLEYTVLK